ncbi:expressed protein [Phakopsora pachyrhizi]|uniref:Expressed protein n=1 Tax=Phakopsora pachyrhizi TaxID=170000 RepID=A0AAV0BS87_PHAPC|nr:expressed protein [Phakopsora pachyrhizi]
MCLFMLLPLALNSFEQIGQAAFSPVLSHFFFPFFESPLSLIVDRDLSLWSFTAFLVAERLVTGLVLVNILFKVELAAPAFDC